MACAPDQTLGWGWSDEGGEQSVTGILGTCIIAAGSAAHVLTMEMMRIAHVGLGSVCATTHGALRFRIVGKHKDSGAERFKS